MKKLLSVLLVIAIIVCATPLGTFTFTASAEDATSGTTGSCTWSLDGTVLTISGDGYMGSCSEDFSPWPRSTITEVIIEAGVKDITSYAFYYCKNLTSVTIPDSVTGIYEYAFYNCDSLTSVTIPDSVISIYNYAFCDCSSLTSITLPDSVTSIGDSAFYATAYYRDKANWQDGVFYIGNHLIYATNATGDCVIKDGTKIIHDEAFYNESITSVTIPNGVTYIGRSAFQGCSSLTSITIPNSVTYIGRYAFCGCSSLSSITIPDSVTYIGEYAFDNCSTYYNNESNWQDGGLYINNHLIDVKSVGDEFVVRDGTKTISPYTFYDCDNLKSITIPDSVVYIGYGAFEDCTAITNLYLDDIAAWCNINFSGSYSNPLSETYNSVNLYLNGEKVTNLVIPDGVTHIPDEMFRMTTITGVAIPDSVTSIGYETFEDCTAITNLYLDDIAAWCNINFSGSYSNPLSETYNSVNLYLNGEKVTNLVIPDGVTEIPDYAFKNTTITSVNIPDSVKSIGNRAFTNCGLLKSVNIENGVANIGEYAFSECKLLENVTLPDSISSIGKYAFSGCSKLKEITLPDSLTVIESGLFKECSTLENVIIPDSVTSIGTSAFYSCNSLTSITIPDSVTSIGNSTFYGCDNLTNVVLGSGITTIANELFTSCYSLASITIPNSVTSIGDSAFLYCSNLTNVTIPDSVTSIGDSAFYYTQLNTLHLGSGIQTIGENAFKISYIYGIDIGDVWYSGSEQQREKIGIYYGNDWLDNATWHYNTCSSDAHVYSGVCDTECSVCGWQRTVETEHVFDYDCDTTCNNCDYVRDVIHIYTGGADKDCGACGFVREIVSLEVNTDTARKTYMLGESFDMAGASLTAYYNDGTIGLITDYDVSGFNSSAVGVNTVTLSHGGKSASFEVNIVAKNTPVFTVQNTTAIVGKTVTVAIDIKNNPGIVSFKLDVTYDTDVLELLYMSSGVFYDVNFGPTWACPTAINWVDTINPNNTTNGTVAYLTFRVKDNVNSCSTAIKISYDSDDVFNLEGDSVTFETVDGAINIFEFITGDVSGDAKINNRDLGILMQHLNYWDVDIVSAACDVTGDGKINNRDYGILMQYLNGWDVELG